MSSFAAMWSPLLFGFALFLNGALMFMMQPMLGRTLLPHLGGNAVAWNACLVFFQGTLMAGAIYAGLLHRAGRLRWQPVLQLILMAIAIVLCFLGLLGDGMFLELAPRLDVLESWPILTTLCLLIVVMGFPLLLLSAVTPLLQRWFAHLDHPKGSDPCFLMTASALGGLIAVILYGLVIGQDTVLRAQWMSWKLSATALGVVLFVVALVCWLSARSAELEPPPPPTDPNAPVTPKLIGRGPATASRRLYWLLASALPIGLLMGMTDYLTLDVGPAPILWTLPLALYLVAFAQSFARFSLLDLGGFGIRLGLQIAYGFLAALVAVILVLTLMDLHAPRPSEEPLVMLASCVFFLTMMLMPFNWLWVMQPISAMVVLYFHEDTARVLHLSVPFALMHLTSYYLGVRLCLGMLAKDRPAAQSLTTYYTWIGIGGLFGAFFHLLAAPLLFCRTNLEYALFLALATTLREAWIPHGLSDWLLCLLLFRRRKGTEQPSSAPPRIARAIDVIFPLITSTVILLVALQVSRADAVSVLLGLLAGLLFFVRPLRSGLALAVIALMVTVSIHPAVVQTRSPFGRLVVFQGGSIQEWTSTHDLRQGTMDRGRCIMEPPEMLRYPTNEYHRRGPVGMVMRNLEWFPTPAAKLKNQRTSVWLQHSRDNSKDDVRIAASLFGMASGSAGMPDLVGSYWSEPPVAFIGLGVGTPFTYAHPCQYFEAYEFDPAVIELSTKETPTFRYYQSARARGVNARIVAGDARRNLREPGREGFYHVLFVDARNAEAIPIHLVTQEAIELYFQKLAPEGVICIHTSSRHVDLTKMLDNASKRLGVAFSVLRLAPMDEKDLVPKEVDPPYCYSSEWVVLARNAGVLQRWTRNDAFSFEPRPVVAPHNPRLSWTDDRANLISAVRPGHAWAIMMQGMLVMLLFFGVFLGMIEVAWSMLPHRPPTQQT